MRRNIAFAMLAASTLTVACGSGDINLSPTTITENSNNTVGGGGTPGSGLCAAFVKAGQTISGVDDGDGNCTYGPEFVGPKNNLTVDLLIPALPDGGAHIFTS